MGFGFGKRVGPVGIHVSSKGINSSASVGAGGLYASKSLGSHSFKKGSSSSADDSLEFVEESEALNDRIAANNALAFSKMPPPDEQSMVLPADEPLPPKTLNERIMAHNNSVWGVPNPEDIVYGS